MECAPVFVRQRKDERRGYAYEEHSQSPLAFGTHPTLPTTIYPIKFTLSLPHVRDSSRVAKFCTLAQESRMTMHADHLHAKPTTSSGIMVIRKMEGMRLDELSRSQRLSNKEKIALIRAIVIALKHQVVDKGIIHYDLHSGNIIIKTKRDRNGSKVFEANIIDYADAYFYREKPDGHVEGIDFLKAYNKDLMMLVYDLVPTCLKRHGKLSKSLTDAIDHAELESTAESLIGIIEAFEYEATSPTASSQSSLSKLFSHLKKLSRTNKGLATELRDIMIEAVGQSSSENLDPMNAAVLHCQQILQERGLDTALFSRTVFDADSKRQLLFVKIFEYFDHLDSKGADLLKNGLETEGNGLCVIAGQMRADVFSAASFPLEQRSQVFSHYRDSYRNRLADHQSAIELHRNARYIFAEILLVLCSLIVLYPIVALVNKELTGNYTFFGQTRSSKGSKTLIDDLDFMSKVRQEIRLGFI